ncbi:bifunctional 3,4-dihydroxy-2-butanone-4-phosphate synthase/GTP cyclohydrolase II, partial [Escherichia coli]
MPTEFGEFDLITFRDTIDNQVHFALKKGEIQADQPTLVRVHLHDVLSDLLLTDRHAARSWPLPKSMARIAEEGGVLVILGAEAHGAELLARVKGFEAADKGLQPEG